ncbi:hypothetical protein [Aeromonas sp. PrichA-15]|uniref:hypothetical protein n=1 Tax=Aeromonas TaxID=642 RepID=UPI001B31C6B2|nr:hypothetical protein [Aeromonas sp. PrichA-15]MBP4031337.1 hypothetical protein [Aeromonas sp. PrichA-15]
MNDVTNFPADFGKGLTAKQAIKAKALSERTNDEILAAVIADLSALPSRTFGNEAIHQRALGDLRHLRQRLRKGGA